MATYSSSTRNGYQLRFTATVTSQNEANNTSTVSWVFAISNGSTYYDARQTGSASLGGVTVWSASGSTFNSGPSRRVKTIASGRRTYSHNNDGSLTLPVSASLRTDTQGTSWAVPQLSLSANFTLPTIPRIPGAPLLPSAALNHDDRTITVTSHIAPSSAPILEYQIRRRNNRGGAWSAYTTVSTGTGRVFTFAAGTAPARYQFQSRARTVAGWGNWSPARTTELVWRAVAPPGLVAISENLSTRRTTLTVPASTANGTPVTRYQVRMRNNHDGAGWTTHNANATTRQYTFTPIPLTRYDFEGRAYTAAGWGPWSANYSSMDSTGTGPKVRDAGTWRDTNAYAKHQGVWRKVQAVYVKVAGQWKIIGR